MAAPLVTWAKRVSGAVDRAKEELHDMPESGTGHGKAVPWPFLDKKPIKEAYSDKELNGFIESAPKRVVSLGKLYAIQHSVKVDDVEEYLDYPDIIPEGSRHWDARTPIDLPIVFRMDGVNRIWDGHHRLTAKWLLGEGTALVRFIDLDSVVKT